MAKKHKDLAISLWHLKPLGSNACCLFVLHQLSLIQSMFLFPVSSTLCMYRNNSTRSCRLSSTSSSAKKRKRVATVAQRRAANIRERRRMFNLNEAFDKLRRKVPTFAYEKRLSRIETLRLAITYISFMDQVIRNETNKPANSSSSTGPVASSSQLPAPSGTVDNSYRESTSWWSIRVRNDQINSFQFSSLFLNTLSQSAN